MTSAVELGCRNRVPMRRTDSNVIETASFSRRNQMSDTVLTYRFTVTLPSGEGWSDDERARYPALWNRVVVKPHHHLPVRQRDQRTRTCRTRAGCGEYCLGGTKSFGIGPVPNTLAPF